MKRFAASGSAPGLIVAAAVSHAHARGRGDDFRIEQDRDGLRIANRRGDRLVFLDDGGARDLGWWRVGLVGDGVRGGAPSFCRSGEGHPVWGRDWCLDKGFGIGEWRDYRWGRSSDLGNLVFVSDGLGRNLVGEALARVIGVRAFNRLALHAVTLGLVDPLVGTWVSTNDGPRLLLVNAGDVRVAEFSDVNRDGRPDNLLVALRSW